MALFLRCCLIRYDALSLASGEAMRRRDFNTLLGALAFAALLGLANSAIAEYPERRRRPVAKC